LLQTLFSLSLSSSRIYTNTPFPEKRKKKSFGFSWAAIKKQTNTPLLAAGKKTKQCLYYWSANPILVVGYKASSTTSDTVTFIGRRRRKIL
jgi:hypothetical protein